MRTITPAAAAAAYTALKATPPLSGDAAKEQESLRYWSSGTVKNTYHELGLPTWVGQSAGNKRDALAALQAGKGPGEVVLAKWLVVGTANTPAKAAAPVVQEQKAPAPVVQEQKAPAVECGACGADVTGLAIDAPCPSCQDGEAEGDTACSACGALCYAADLLEGMCLECADVATSPAPEEALAGGVVEVTAADREAQKAACTPLTEQEKAARALLIHSAIGTGPAPAGLLAKAGVVPTLDTTTTPSDGVVVEGNREYRRVESAPAPVPAPQTSEQMRPAVLERRAKETQAKHEAKTPRLPEGVTVERVATWGHMLDGLVTSLRGNLKAGDGHALHGLLSTLEGCQETLNRILRPEVQTEAAPVPSKPDRTPAGTRERAPEAPKGPAVGAPVPTPPAPATPPATPAPAPAAPKAPEGKPPVVLTSRKEAAEMAAKLGLPDTGVVEVIVARLKAAGVAVEYKAPKEAKPKGGKKGTGEKQDKADVARHTKLVSTYKAMRLEGWGICHDWKLEGLVEQMSKAIQVRATAIEEHKAAITKAEKEMALLQAALQG